ncbi:MAG TPA: DHA2 family efflux MFS transporter permease subunit [Streptosporangiaceae bacterium]|nr:DHA2 family efflux MFS transporter permease subunit [Streptosporangiaceae bacterium]
MNSRKVIHMDARQRWTLILTSVASLMVGLDLTVVTTALNTIRLDLGASIAELDWTINAYTLSIGVFLLTAAAAGDRLGRRRVLVAGLAVFTASSAACALAPSISVLIAARAAQGIGTAMVLPQALALLSAAFPPETRGRAMGLFAGITGLAILGGPVIGGAVVQGMAWQWIFWLNVPVGIVLMSLVGRRMAEARGPRTAFDVPGLVLSGAGLLGLVWGLIRGNAVGWGSPQVYGPLAAGVALIVAFAAWERRARSPMLPMSFFRNVPYVSANAAGFAMTAAMMGGVVFFVQYLQASLGEGPLDAGVRLLPLTATLFVVAPIAGRLVARVGERPIVVMGLLGQTAGLVWIALSTGASYPALIPGMVLTGIGVSAAMPAAQNAAIGAVGREAIGTASGVYNAMRQVGGAFGIAIASAVFAAAGSFASPISVSHGVRAALLATAGIAAIGALAGAGLQVRKAAGPPASATRPAGNGATPGLSPVR